MQKWEYLIIRYWFSLLVARASCAWIHGRDARATVQTEPVPIIRVNSDAADLGETTKEINKLGKDGWELAGASQHNFRQTLIFKRPISN